MLALLRWSASLLFIALILGYITRHPAQRPGSVTHRHSLDYSPGESLPAFISNSLYSMGIVMPKRWQSALTSR